MVDKQYIGNETEAKQSKVKRSEEVNVHVFTYFTN